VKTSGERIGDRHQLALVDDGQLGLAAAADDAHDAVALGEPLRPGAAGDDLAGQLEAGDVGGHAGRGRIAAAALEQVRAVEPGRADAHEDLVRAGLGVRVLLDEHLAVADGGRAHV
jgi:hypothetical protein